MASTALTLCDRIVTALNGESFSQEFTAVRSYVPLYDPQELQTLKVTVVPQARTDQPETRADFSREHTVAVGIQKYAATTAEIDSLMELVEEVINFLDDEDITEAHLLEYEVDYSLLPEMLDRHNVFTVPIRLIYRTL